MQNKKIAIIGGGNLGQAIAAGLLKSEQIQAQDLTVTRRNTKALSKLAAQGVKVHSDNLQACRESDVIILALKPYRVAPILDTLAPALKPEQHLLISVATGVKIETLQQHTNPGIRTVRAMPNTAIAVGESMTCVASNQSCTDDDLEYTRQIFSLMGSAEIIQEELMEAATVLAASGIAYALRYIRANMQGGVQIGFSSDLALHIATQTVKGAAELLLRNGLHPEAEIDKVTTPMGITIAGINEMEHQGFSSSLIRGIATSYDKIGK